MSSATVLIIDDSPDIRAIIRRLLSTHGYSIVEASSGYEAIHMARQCRPDLIITDLSLPGLDGWEVIRHIRTEPALEDIPIIAMTGYGLLAAAQAAFGAGCQRVILKPLKLDDLERAVTTLIAPVRRPARAPDSPSNADRSMHLALPVLRLDGV